MFWQFFFKLFRLDYEPEDISCPSCEYFKIALENERRERSLLLDKLLNKETPEVVEKVSDEDAFKPLRNRYKPFSVVRQELEQKSRDEAKELRLKREAHIEASKSFVGSEVKGKQSISDLEDFLGVNDVPEKSVGEGNG